MTFVVSEAATPEDRKTCAALRRQVFVEEQGVSEAEEIDGLDDVAMHLLARDRDLPVGTLRIRFVGDAAKIERVCVLSDYRGRNVGLALMRAALDRVSQMPGLSQVRLGAQVTVIGFYRRLGFRVEGDEFLDAGIPHRHMVLDP
ncbi:GNAT family N-acetyltransferase [Tropicimonas sp.]|uniref:GNAT family N-acetyltransferase n=1 Tax=Tropicimonas sp. TaxID=2067044 RepID=UPI003A87EE00